MTVLKLEDMWTDKTAFHTKSDCESVIHLYESRPSFNLGWTLRRLDGLISLQMDSKAFRSAVL